MTDIEQKALKLVNEVCRQGCWDTVDLYRARIEYGGCFEALCRAIEQHEAFRQEVSDAVEHFKRCYPGYQHASLFDRFIIAKPDPLLEAWKEAHDVCEGESKFETGVHEDCDTAADRIEALIEENERLRDILEQWLETAREHLDTEVAGRTFEALERTK